jgi:predicted RND superfamily exporter protein
MPAPLRHLVRIGLAALTAILAVNLYTGAPLFAIWVGSRFSTGTQLTMGVVGIVIAVLVASIALLVFLLTRVEAAYKVVTGQKTDRRTPPWLRSMRAERDEFERSKRELTGFEKVLAATVVLGIVAFEAWFFFFSGSPIG